MAYYSSHKASLPAMSMYVPYILQMCMQHQLGANMDACFIYIIKVLLIFIIKNESRFFLIIILCHSLKFDSHLILKEYLIYLISE